MAPLLISGAIALAKEFLPSLVGKVAGDTSGAVASKVIDIAATLTGAPIKTADDFDSVAQIFRASPELGMQFQTRMAELELEETKAFLGDRQDARNRDIELAKSGKANVRADVMVVAAFVAIIVIAVFLIMKNKIDPGVMAFLTTLGGMLMKNISTAFDFEFGSSRSSKGKSEDMGKLMQVLGDKGGSR